MSSAAANSSVKHRDYSFLGLTQSLCPECRTVVPAKIIARGPRVYFRKQCPTHGLREDFVCSDRARYDLVETSLPAKLPQKTFAESLKGCPHDCGLCQEHEQHTCIGVVEITDSCNLTCPMCYAASAPGLQHKSLEDIQSAIDRLIEAEGRAEVVQLSGGEPTLHPKLLQAVDYALARPIDYVMINTNGLRLASDRELVSQLAKRRERLEIYFQLDSLNDAETAKLRGETGLVARKLRALDNLASEGLNVTLVSTLQADVNNTAPGELVHFACGRPEITGISLQPATYSGRYTLPEELEERITFPDVIDSIVADDRNSFDHQDFFPLPCAHPNCHWIALAVREKNELVPVTNLLDASKYLDLLANGISFTRDKTQQLARQVMSRMACGDSGCCTPNAGASNVGASNVGPGVSASAAFDVTPDSIASMMPVVGESSILGSSQSPSKNGVNSPEAVLKFLEGLVSQSVGARDMLRITITSFLDVYNFDVRRVMKCCTHHVLPSGHIIPFCAYNVLYRDGTVPLPELTKGP